MLSPASLFKPALTERQQMALLLQMTDPQKQTQGLSVQIHMYIPIYLSIHLSIYIYLYNYISVFSFTMTTTFSYTCSYSMPGCLY